HDNQVFKRFGVSNVEDEVFGGIDDWPTTNFKTLTVEHQCLVPKISDHTITNYFIERISMDNQMSGDIEALKKGRAMMNGLKVNALSINLENEDVLFLTGFTAASMKKRYII
ncbi:unnamed protein product, partial [Owenia fusiformis]